MFVKQKRQYLVKLNEFYTWPILIAAISTGNLYMTLTLKIRSKPIKVTGLFKAFKGDIYFIDKTNKKCYGPGTKVIDII